MKEKTILLIIVLFLSFQSGYGQELYQQGRSTHIDIPRFEIGYTRGDLSFFHLSDAFRYRLTDRFDAGLFVDYRSINPNTDISQSKQGHSLTFGPVFGHTSILSKGGWGLRSSLALRVTLSNLTRGSEISGLSLAGYGTDIDVSLFKRIDLGKSIRAYPSVGFFMSITHFTGRNFDEYGLSRIYVPQTRLKYEESAGTPFVSGTLFQLPISFKVFGNKRLILVPSYWFNSYDSVNGINGLFRMVIQFSF